MDRSSGKGARQRRLRRRRRLPWVVQWSSSVAAAVFLLVLAVLVLGCTSAAADPPKQGKPQVWDGGAWHFFEEEIKPDEPKPYPPVSDSWRRDDTAVHVSVSSFRDPRCAKTLFNLYTKAKHPERVHVGVVQQNSEGDMDCLIGYCSMMKREKNLQPDISENTPVRTGHAPALENCPFGAQISIMRVAAEEAKGPTYGRYLQSKLIGADREFCMQIDAHMDVLYNWDTILLNMWGMVDNEYAVLTTYVNRLEEMGINVNERWEVPHICRAFFTPGGDGMVRNEQAKAAMWLTRPKLTSTWAAGFAFNKCHADRRTPYDPHLPSLFDGEEYSKYARLWTRGYDTYTPHRSVVYHDYNHNAATSAASSWSRKSHELKRAHSRLKVLLGYPDAPIERNSTEAHAFLGKWDLGTRRTLDQLIEFTGVDTRKKEITKSSCQRLVWVPFDREHEGFDDDEDPMLPASFNHHGHHRDREQRRRTTTLLEEKEEGRASRWSAKRYPGLVTMLWLFLGFLVGLRLRSRSKHSRHACGASALLAMSHSRWGSVQRRRRREDVLCPLGGGGGVGYQHESDSGEGEGHYVVAEV